MSDETYYDVVVIGGAPGGYVAAKRAIRRRWLCRSTSRETLRPRRVVLVGDRGIITTARIEHDLKPAGLDWITALRAPAIQALAADDGPLQLSFFDDRDLTEIVSPDYRLIVCRNGGSDGGAGAQARGPARSIRRGSRQDLGSHNAPAIPCAAPHRVFAHHSCHAQQRWVDRVAAQRRDVRDSTGVRNRQNRRAQHIALRPAHSG